MSGEPDILVDVNELGAGSLPDVLKRSSEKRSDNMADFESTEREVDVEGETWVWPESGDGSGGTIPFWGMDSCVSGE
jgi:hypothetical protein